MVAFSRHILTIALFLLLEKLGCLFNKTLNDGFRYNIFAFLAKNSTETLICDYYQQQGLPCRLFVGNWQAEFGKNFFHVLPDLSAVLL